MGTTRWRIRRLHSLGESEVEGLARVLVDCVRGGASVSFMQPLTLERATEFYRSAGGLCDTTVHYRELGEKSPPPPRPREALPQRLDDGRQYGAHVDRHHLVEARHVFHGLFGCGRP